MFTYFRLASVLVYDDAIAAVVAAVDHGERAVLIVVAEGEESVVHQVHLEDGLVHRHGTEEETLGADHLIGGILLLIGLGDKGLLVGDEGLLAQALFQAGFVLDRKSVV